MRADHFRAILGDHVYELAQAGEDAKQGNYLTEILAPTSGWEIYVAENRGEVDGFVSLQARHESRVGEIGLNAVDPKHAGKGIGTALYRFALEQLRAAGMRVATVSTGGDPSHAPARRAYEKVGFSVGVPSVWLCCPL